MTYAQKAGRRTQHKNHLVVFSPRKKLSSDEKYCDFSVTRNESSVMYSDKGFSVTLFLSVTSVESVTV